MGVCIEWVGWVNVKDKAHGFITVSYNKRNTRMIMEQPSEIPRILFC